MHIALIRFLPCTKAKSRVNAFKKSVVVVRIKEKIAIVFSHTKLIALPKHKNKYYPKKKKKKLLSELYPGASFQEFFELYNNQLLRFSISVSSLTLLAYCFFFFFWQKYYMLLLLLLLWESKTETIIKTEYEANQSTQLPLQGEGNLQFKVLSL